MANRIDYLRAFVVLLQIFVFFQQSSRHQLLMMRRRRRRLRMRQMVIINAMRRRRVWAHPRTQQWWDGIVPGFDEHSTNSAAETKCLVAILASTEFQEKLESGTRKTKLYSVMGQRPANQVTGALNSATAASTIADLPPAMPGSSSTTDELSDTDDTTTSEPSTNREGSIAASEEREIPGQRQARKRGTKRKRDDKKQDALLAYLEKMHEKADAREERMMEQQERSTTSLLGLVERMVSAIEGLNNPNQGQN
ncbi:uncharacterized protein ACJ7VT_001151 [Polymixia lowei]